MPMEGNKALGIGEKRAEIYTYESANLVYAMNWSVSCRTAPPLLYQWPGGLCCHHLTVVATLRSTSSAGCGLAE